MTLCRSTHVDAACSLLGDSEDNTDPADAGDLADSGDNTNPADAGDN